MKSVHEICLSRILKCILLKTNLFIIKNETKIILLSLNTYNKVHVFVVKH